MANNPLSAPLSSIKQVGDQLTQGLQTMASGLSTSLSQGLDNLANGLPALPGLPGGQAAGGLPGLPSLQSVMPANLTQALTQIENVVIPQGLPKVSSLINPAPAGGGAPAPAAAAAPSNVGVVIQGSPTSPSIIQQPDGSKPANTAIQGRRRITQLGGY